MSSISSTLLESTGKAITGGISAVGAMNLARSFTPLNAVTLPALNVFAAVALPLFVTHTVNQIARNTLLIRKFERGFGMRTQPLHPDWHLYEGNQKKNRERVIVVINFVSLVISSIVSSILFGVNLPTTLTLTLTAALIQKLYQSCLSGKEWFSAFQKRFRNISIPDNANPYQDQSMGERLPHQDLYPLRRIEVEEGKGLRRAAVVRRYLAHQTIPYSWE